MITAMELEHEQISVEIRRAVVGYCDVSDFMSWIQRSAVSNRDITSFLKKMKWTFRKFREATGYFSIPIGDGIIAILDSVPENKPVNVYRFVTSLWELGRDLSFLADGESRPRPGRSRIRITAGTVYRTEEPPSSIPKVPTVDFIGEPLNLGSRLLHVMRDVPALITKTALDSIAMEDRNRLIIQVIAIRGPIPRDVGMEDLRGLCAFQPKHQNSP